jgi:hypothetical protein
VHDTSDFEARGLPAVFVASREFAQAAEAQATALGFAARHVLVPHPIQDRTDDEMRAHADAAYADLVAAVSG